MRRLLKIRTASFTWGSEAATIEAMAQIGFSSSRMCVSTYQVTVVPIKTLTANLTPMMSRWSEMSHVMGALVMRVSSRSLPKPVRFRLDQEGDSQVGDT
jgi:hypothetical protein